MQMIDVAALVYELRAVRRDGFALGIDDPHERRAGGEIVGDLAADLGRAVAWRKYFHSSLRIASRRGMRFQIWPFTYTAWIPRNNSRKPSTCLFEGSFTN